MKKKSAFQKYLEQWGLDRYRFLSANKDEVYVYPLPKYKYINHNPYEIKDINTFIRKSLKTFILDATEPLTLPELKQRALIEKLSGL